MPRCSMFSVARAARRSSRAREAVELCSRHGFAYYLAMANVLTGWAEAAEGDVAGGLAQLREGLEGMRRLGAELRLPYYFTLLAETFGRAGLVGEALASLSTGFAFASKNGEEWAVAELHRVQGELLAAEGKRAAAQASFRRGIEMRRGAQVRWRSNENCRFLRTERRNRPHRTLLERHAGQSGYIPVVPAAQPVHAASAAKVRAASAANRT